MSNSSSSRLDEIVSWHRARAASDQRDEQELLAAASSCEPSKSFAGALGGSGLSVIAEIKRRSPSAGDISPHLEPYVLAAEYERGGAACISVLTDEAFFGGSPDDLRVAKEAVHVPVLRKDFTVCKADLADARLMGADAVLLIAAALNDAELLELHNTAGSLDLDVLVEVHDDSEAKRVCSFIDLRLIGVNQRDLNTFAIDTGNAEALMQDLPQGVLKVAESGISSVQQARQLAEVGYDAVLVGTHLITAPSPEDAVRELVQACL